MSEDIFNLDIFKWIEKNIVEKIILNCKDRFFKEWEIIIKEWDESNWEWYILKNGKVSILIKWKQITELNEWDIFWEIALLNEEKRIATITAISDIEVIILNYNNLIEMIDHDENFINKKILSRIEENIDRGY